MQIKFSLPSLRYIILFNLILKVGLFLYTAPWKESVEKKMIVGDSEGYQRIALSLLKDHSYSPPLDTNNISFYSENTLKKYLTQHKDAMRLPVYPTYIAFVYLIAGAKPFIVIFIQLLFSLFSVALVYNICFLLFNNKNIGLIASFIFCFDPDSIYESNRLLTDTFFVLFLLASVYYFLKYLKKSEFKNIYLSAIWMGITCLTRPVAMLYSILPMIMLFCFKKESVKVKIKSCVVYVLMVSAFVGMWSYRNHCKYQTWQLTAQSGPLVFMWDAAMTEAKRTNKTLQEVRYQFQLQADSLGFKTEKSVFKQTAIYEKLGMNYIKQHTGYFIFNYIEGSVKMFFIYGSGHAKNTTQRTIDILAALVLLLQYIGFLYGLVQLFRRKKYLPLVLCIITIFYFMLVTGVIGEMLERYKLPIVPFICICSGYGYYCLIEKTKAIKS